jgi:hypothetical protein
MTLKQIREKARNIGVTNINRYRKENLIRIIQEIEGNSPCYKNIFNCWEFRCLWREECQN